MKRPETLWPMRYQPSIWTSCPSLLMSTGPRPWTLWKRPRNSRCSSKEAISSAGSTDSRRPTT
ncbi:hypothetical protein ACFFX0_09240 [Citricoccus parietis]|uniref:Uncharacterized protein n=1 Tax=Citricoccus parietis TaxID=592307 RepID=A0ABV5FXF2_9MICC